jgi:glycosyltransferase involved in cell wall biosynthesis
LLYQDTDIFVAPFHTDTFGFVLLEAFAHGIPCVVARQFATPEIVTHGVTGLVIENHASRFGDDRLPKYSRLGDGSAPLLKQLRNPPAPYVAQLVDALESMIVDDATRTAMADAAYREVLEGRFSVAARRAALAEVYSATADIARPAAQA